VPEDEDWFRVDDRVLGDEPFAALWNIGPDVEDVVQRPTDEKGTFEWILTSKRGNRFKLAVSITGNVLDEEAVVEVASGRQLPMLGWYSPGFEEKTPSTVLVFHLSPLGALTMTTRVERLP
jgi:hypothetical protein